MDDIVDINDSQSVLLPEILSHIFAYLPLTDRKSVRLTCQLWYDCSVHPNIIKCEKYVFRVDCSIEDIFEFMLRSNYSSLNLEFQGVRLKELAADAWKVCGERIQTLECYECRWSYETIRNVFLHCQNLTSIVIKAIPSCLEGMRDPTRILCSSSLLNDFIKKGLRRSKLRAFAMFNEDVQLPESAINKIFLFFPGIKHFSTGVVSSALYLREPPRSLRLDHCFNPETRLESLTLNSLMDGNWIKTVAEQGFRLKKLETTLTYRRSMEDTFFAFFKSQRNLEVLKLGITDANNDEYKKLFFHILDSCPNLREFSFESEVLFLFIDPSELPRFISSISKLKFLNTVFYERYDTSPLPLYQDLLENPVQLNLTSLRWDSKDVDFCAVFFQRCPSLLHLHFGECCDKTLQIIFQFLVELRTLILSNIDVSCTDFGFTGRGAGGVKKGYSIKRLQQLKYLKLRGTMTCMTGESILELQLPRLEFLSLDMAWLMRLDSEEALVNFTSGLPELRVLAIKQLYPSRFHWIAMGLLLGFENLFCLQIQKDRLFFNSPRNMPFVEYIFGCNPHLRYFCDSETGVYFRNPFTGKVLHCDLLIFKFPGNVFEGELSVST